LEVEAHKSTYSILTVRCITAPMKLDTTVRKETGYRLGDWDSIPARAKDFSIHHHYLTSSEAHLVSYPVATRSSFARGKVDQA
jgi:hypothetical protein